MSLAEIEEAVDKLSAAELAKLAAHIARRDKIAWDKEIEDAFSPGGKHEKALEKIDAEIDADNFGDLELNELFRIAAASEPYKEVDGDGRLGKLSL